MPADHEKPANHWLSPVDRRQKTIVCRTETVPAFHNSSWACSPCRQTTKNQQTTGYRQSTDDKKRSSVVRKRCRLFITVRGLVAHAGRPRKTSKPLAIASRPRTKNDILSYGNGAGFS